MKKKLTAVIIAASCIAVGAVLCALTWREAAGPDLGAAPVQNTYSFAAEGLERISISTPADDVRVKNGAGDRITVTVWENSYRRYEMKTENGELEIDFSPRWRLGFDLAPTAESGIVVEIPAGLEAGYDIDSASGRITLDAGLAAFIDAESSSGSINCENTRVCGGVELNSSSGDIRVSGLSCASLEADTSSGGVSLGCDCSGKVSVDTSSGSIELNAAYAGGGFELESASGHVRGTVEGDAAAYKLDADSSSGQVDVPNPTSGTRPLRVRTSSGDIFLRFTR